jgi:hypothetical protein
VLEYPKGVEGLAQVWSRDSQITRRTQWSTLSRHTHLSYLASDSAFDEEKPASEARNDAFTGSPGSSNLLQWERWLKLDPLFAAGCLSAEQTTGIDWRKADGTKDHPAWASVPIETEPCKYDPVVLLALNPRCQGREHHPIRHCGGQNMVACPGLPSLSWAATRQTQPRLGGLPFDCAAYHVGLADSHG